MTSIHGNNRLRHHCDPISDARFGIRIRSRRMSVPTPIPSVLSRLAPFTYTEYIKDKMNTTTTEVRTTEHSRTTNKYDVAEGHFPIRRWKEAGSEFRAVSGWCMVGLDQWPPGWSDARQNSCRRHRDLIQLSIYSYLYVAFPVRGGVYARYISRI